MTKYWIIVASEDHVMRGVFLGIAAGGMETVRWRGWYKGDMIVYYSPKTRFDGSEALHAFTAIGVIEDDALFQVEETPDFRPFRRKVHYIKTGKVRIKPLVPELTFIRNKKSWGYAFRSVCWKSRRMILIVSWSIFPHNE